MKPLKLYTRMTLWTAVVLTLVLLLFVYFFATKVKSLELQDQEQRAMIWATQLANVLTYGSSLTTSELQARAWKFKDDREGQIQQIRIYGQTNKGLTEVIRLEQDEREVIAAADLVPLKRGEPVAHLRVRTTDTGTASVIYAAAPIFENNDFRGAVSLTTTAVEFSDLPQRITSIAIALLAFAVLVITGLFYVLFSQVLYKPVEDLLRTMSAVRAGNLEAAAPVRVRDEFGQLAVSFNHMIARLRAMTSEREAYQKQLEGRVQEATLALAERNTQLEEANTTLFEYQRELTKFERLAAAGQLAAQFAHEVGTPLNLISGHVQLLTARTTDAKTCERLELISAQIARIERIVRNMLDATRRPQPQLEPLDLNLLLRRIFEVTAPTLAAHQVELQTDFAPGLPLISGDGEQLQQVFINLINNSLDAMPAGGQLHFSTAAANGFVVVHCRDTGEGIKDEIKARIFDPLFTTKPAGRGSGLGLSVVQQILREHGGNITVASTPGAGAEFQLRLPIAEERANTAQQKV
ncbi:MAG: ATP-binding protein [Acidobacteriota bacterium]